MECYCWGNPNKHCRLQLVGLGFGEHGATRGEANRAEKSVNDRLAKICVYQFGKDPEKDLQACEEFDKETSLDGIRVDYVTT